VYYVPEEADLPAYLYASRMRNLVGYSNSGDSSDPDLLIL
jgi:hypothetical protein